MNADLDKQVSVTLTVRKWQLDYSARMMAEQGYKSETEFVQAVLNTALLRHIPQDAWPPMSVAEKKKLKEMVAQGDVDADIPI